MPPLLTSCGVYIFNEKLNINKKIASMRKSNSFHTQGKVAVSQISTFLCSQQEIVFLKTKMSI